MNKKELVSRLATHLKPKASRRKLEIMVDLMLHLITCALVKKEKVRLVGFGQFVLRRRKGGWQARNPSTGEKMLVKDRDYVAFIPGSSLKKAVRKEK